ncbi:MAG: hypothetical protein HXS42_13345 [Theionarchaea archaeon]|nr:hypothetical protein [Theionarchaea archaeon]
MRVFKSITVNIRAKIAIMMCTVCVCIIMYLLIGLEKSVLSLAFLGILLSIIRLFWSWRVWGEQFVDVAFLLSFVMISLVSLYEVPYLPAIMTFFAILRVYTTGVYLRKDRERDFRSILHEISVTLASICGAVLVVAMYSEKEAVIIPFLIVGMGSLAFSFMVKRL